MQTALGSSWIKPGIWAEVQAYYRNLEGLQRYRRYFDQNTNSNPAEELMVEGTGYVVGLDAFVRVQKGPWMGWAAYTLSEVIHEFDSLNSGEPFPADHDHLHELKFVNALRLKNWEFSITWILASGKPYSNGIALDPCWFCPRVCSLENKMIFFWSCLTLVWTLCHTP